MEDLEGGKERNKRGTHFHETGGENQCQCFANCPHKSLEGEAFCQEHLHKCLRTSPLTGAEPAYEPNRWNLNKKFKSTHNCFAYSMNIFDKRQLTRCKKKDCNVSFHQPGEASGYRRFSDANPKTCPNLIARVIGDNPTIVISDFTSKCPENTSKIAIIIDESDDYHFLRQDANKFWSHKPGARDVTNVDALGHRIWDPKLAYYNYTDKPKNILNYDIFCSYMCVPRDRPLYLKATGGGRRRRPYRTAVTRRRRRRAF
jgi:hypothetical protein